MDNRRIKSALLVFLTSVFCVACTTRIDQAPSAQTQQEREVIETTPYVVPGIGVGGFSAPGLGSGGFFGGGIGVFEEEEEEG